MNFFESQDIAKRNTGRLIFLFVMAVVSLIVITNLLVMLVFGFLSPSGQGSVGIDRQLDWGTFVVISGAVVAVILLGSLYKLSALAGGGARVAEMLNGRLLLPESDDFHERQVLNVVEEMALASGTPVPPVYLLEEPGINAFAAGYEPSDAIIGITRGAIDSFTRDELQGVIAHEFSHILHGDMRINIRLIAILHGILILGILGYFLMRGGVYSRRSKNSGGIMMLGLGLLVVGFVGTFFGNLIKAAVSRQREFLADASSVQFTRNPDGIAGALMRIATHDGRSYLNNPSSMEISHTLFEEGVVTRFRGLYATHPPLEERIKAILPNWNGEYEVAEPIANDKSATAKSSDDQPLGSGSTGQRKKAEAMLTGAIGVLMTDAFIDQIGQPGKTHIEQAKQILLNIPQELLAAAHGPSTARAVIYLLLIDTDKSVQKDQMAFLEQSADHGIFTELQKLCAYSSELLPEFRLPLIQIAISSMRQLSVPQYHLFKENLNKLIKLDNKINLFEWALHKIIFKNLEPVFEKQTRFKVGRRELKTCKEALEVLLSILAVADTKSKADPIMAFDKAKQELGISEVHFMEKSQISFEMLNDALDELSELKPLQKPALLKACVACIVADRKVAPIELELLRAVGATLNCPIPPIAIS